MPKILIDAAIPYIHGLLEPFADVEYLPSGGFRREVVKNADALIIRTRTQCNKDLLHGSNVKFIGTATAGIDHIDTEYCQQAGITYTNAPGCNADSVANYVASALCTLSAQFALPLTNLTIGIVGVGQVGSRVDKIAKALGMKVLLNDPFRAEKEGSALFEPLDELLEQADVLSLHVPLTQHAESKYPTYHLFDKDLINYLPRRTVLINTSRGEVLDNQALLQSLHEKRIAGAVLDVWENEPMVDCRLMRLLNIATPHIAGYSADGKAHATEMVLRALATEWNIPELKNLIVSCPKPEQELSFTLDAYGKSTQQILSEAIWYAYSINDDDGRLRYQPENFEQLRTAYPIRRDFNAYSINLRNADDITATALAKLGFNVLTL